MQQLDVSTDMFIDPVCWMKVPSYRRNFRTTYSMRTYYFCSEDCRKAFQADPNKYLEIRLPWHKGWLKLYLKRLKNPTNQSAQ